MQTIEFQSVVENDVIRIPEAYRGTFTAPVTVTLREDRPVTLTTHRKKGRISAEDVLAPCISTAGWKFNREEAHER
jgi:hypothetical protein